MELIATNDDVVFFSMKFSVKHRNGNRREKGKGEWKIQALIVHKLKVEA